MKYRKPTMFKKLKYAPFFLINPDQQYPYTFTGPDDLPYPAMNLRLEAGDYSIAAIYPDDEDDIVNTTVITTLYGKVAIKRNTLDGFVDSISKDRDRFMREIKKLKKHRFRAVVIEASLYDILRGRYASQVSVATVLGMIARLYFKGIPVLLVGDRYIGQEITKKLLLSVLKYEIITNKCIDK